MTKNKQKTGLGLTAIVAILSVAFFGGAAHSQQTYAEPPTDGDQVVSPLAGLLNWIVNEIEQLKQPPKYYTEFEPYAVIQDKFVWDRIVLCDEGDIATGGGYDTNDPTLNVILNHPYNFASGNPNGWVAGYTQATGEGNFNVHVVCLDLVPYRT